MIAPTTPASPPSSSLPQAVALDGVCFSYRGEDILTSITLHVAQGEFLALLGPNGGGKTTLLRIMMGLLSQNSGSVAVFGKKPNLARMHVGYVPQFSSIRQEFPTTVLETTLMGAACLAPQNGRHSLFRQKLWPDDALARDKAMNLLDLLGIADIAARPVHALSGGQRQRLMVARALMGRQERAPFLLLLDEPTASIDQYGKGCFYDFLDTLRSDITIIIVSHDLTMASPFFSRVALVNKTLSILPDGCPHSDIMRSFIGPQHGPECPLWQITRSSDAECTCHPHTDSANNRALPNALHGSGLS